MPASASSSYGSPLTCFCTSSSRSCGRARLPTCVVRMRSVLRFIGRACYLTSSGSADAVAVDAARLEVVDQTLLLHHALDEHVLVERGARPGDRAFGSILHHPEQLH